MPTPTENIKAKAIAQAEKEEAKYQAEKVIYLKKMEEKQKKMDEKEFLRRETCYAKRHITYQKKNIRDGEILPNGKIKKTTEYQERLDAYMLKDKKHTAKQFQVELLKLYKAQFRMLEAAKDLNSAQSDFNQTLLENNPTLI